MGLDCCYLRVHIKGSSCWYCMDSVRATQLQLDSGLNSAYLSLYKRDSAMAT